MSKSYDPNLLYNIEIMRGLKVLHDSLCFGVHRYNMDKCTLLCRSWQGRLRLAQRRPRDLWNVAVGDSSSSLTLESFLDRQQKMHADDRSFGMIPFEVTFGRNALHIRHGVIIMDARFAVLTPTLSLEHYAESGRRSMYLRSFRPALVRGEASMPSGHCI